MRRLLAATALAFLASGLPAMDDASLRLLLVGTPSELRAWADKAGPSLNQDIFVDLRPIMLVADRFDPRSSANARAEIFSVFEYFVKRGAEPDPWSCARVGDAVRLKAILDAKPDSISFLTGTGDTLLCGAAKSGSLECLSLLLSLKADPNESDARGSTPLMLAAEGGLLEIAEKLLDSGAETSLLGGDGKSALEKAVKAGQAEMARLLREKGASD